MEFLEFYQQKQDELESAGLNRRLTSGFGLDFCSNDYLGLSEDPELKKRIIKKMESLPLGSTGSRLLRGHSDFIHALEGQLAKYSQTEAALFFPSGYQANLGLFSTLLKEKATVFTDELIHASIIDGVRLSGCEKYIWSHNDLAELEMLLRQKAKPEKMNFVVVESIYSMRGDFAPLKELAELCKVYSVNLIVDEAHATGLFGATGSGRVEECDLKKEVFATIHTAGKALGVSGAWVAGSEALKNLMVNISRPFIYSTAPSFYQQAALSEVINYLGERRPELMAFYQKRLNGLQDFLQSLSSANDIEVVGMGGPVTAIVVKENVRAVLLMTRLKEKGFDVRAIRPPSVPQGQALLRVTIPTTRTDEEISRFQESISLCLESLR